MNSAADDIKDFLLDKSGESDSDLDLILGTNLFVGILPENQVICTAVLDTPGAPPEPNNIRLPTVQILTRGTVGGYVAAWNKIEDIINELHEVANTTINSTNYIQIYKFGEISHVGNDSKNRPMFSCTLAIKRA